jgi:hypothetical protein
MTSDYSVSPIGTLISDLKFSLHINFIKARVVYAPRVCNRPDDELPASGVGGVHGDHAIWTTNFPNLVSHLVTSDIAVS